MYALQQERQRHDRLKRRHDDLEDRYGEKCRVATSQKRRADSLAADLDKSMTKNKASDYEIMRLEEKLRDERRSNDKAVQDAEDEIAELKSTVEQLKQSLTAKDAKIRNLEEKPVTAEGFVQTDSIPADKTPGAASPAQGQTRIFTTLPHLAAVFRKYVTTKQLQSALYKKNITNALLAFMQHFTFDAGHEKTIRVYLGKGILDLRKERSALKEQKTKVDRLMK